MEPRIDAEVIMIPLNMTRWLLTGTISRVYGAKASAENNYLPGGSKDGKAHCDADSKVGPGIGADAVEDILPTSVLA